MLHQFLYGYMLAWFIAWGVFAIEAIFVAGLNLAIKRVGFKGLPTILFQLHMDLGPSFLGTVIRSMTYKPKDISVLARIAIFLFSLVWFITFLPIFCLVYFGYLTYIWVYRYIAGNEGKKNVTA